MPGSPVTFPLGPPTVSGTTITVDQALNDNPVLGKFLARLQLSNRRTIEPVEFECHRRSFLFRSGGSRRKFPRQFVCGGK